MGVALVLAVLLLSLIGAAPPAAASTPPRPVLNAGPSDPGRNPSPAERAWVAASLYRTVKEYFAHWSGLPADYDFDAAFRSYLDEALAAPDRRAFSLATMRLMAGLHNGHTGFTDRTLSRDARPAPFYAEPVDGRWTVISSRLRDLAPGDVILAVDGAPIEDWVAPIRAVVGQSSPRARDHQAFFARFMLPERFVLGLDDGRRVAVSRDGPFVERRGRARPSEVTVERRPDGVVVVAIPSFGEPRFEADAVKAVREAAGARLIVLDVRGNGGGSTPGALLHAVMTRPYAGTVVMTPLIKAEDDARRSFGPPTDRASVTYLRRGPDVTAPDAGAYAGPMALLVDGDCASACEDLAISFQSGRRGPVLGEATFGSTGQPYQVDFPELGMSLRVSTKRESFADGSPFEGVGIRPDLPILRTRADLHASGDPVLDRAIAAALAATPVATGR